MENTFTPGDIIRLGKDNAVYVRAVDGSWLCAHIGTAQHPAPSGYVTWRDDTTARRYVSDGIATVIYKSIGHYDTPGWDFGDALSA